MVVACGPNFERNVLAQVLIHEERQGAALEFIEALFLGVNDVPPRREEGNLITCRRWRW